jgi:IS5 family transposase
MKKYGITIINELEKNVLEVALDHMKEHLEALIDFNNPNNDYYTIENYQMWTKKHQLQEKLEACKNLKNSLK